MNEITDDMVWNEGNLPTGHRTSVQTSLPTGTWRRFNEGIAPTKSTSTQITDSCGMLETYSEIDKALADLNGNTATYRLSEDRAFLEGLTQQLAGVLFYGNTATNPERFMGFAPRYNTTLDGDVADRQQLHLGRRRGLRQHVDLAGRLGRPHRARHLPARAARPACR